MTVPTYQSYIHGQYVANQTGESFPVLNPATGDCIYRVEQASQELVEQSVQSAGRGFAAWSALTGMERMRILNRVVALLRERNDELARIEVLDTGKPWQEAVAVDVVYGADSIEFFAGLAPSISGQYQDLGGDFYYTRREPLGICAGIGAWNYPIQIACWKSAPALACGNAMIFKPSEETPLGALKLAEIMIEAGVPEGVFNVVQGDYRVGQALTGHPKIVKVSFTGEVVTGKKVMADSASSIKELTMELGGKSPLIIFPDTDLENAVSGALLANFYTQGEICTNGTRVFVHEDIYESFLERAQFRTENRIVIGDPLNPEINLGALISAEHLQKVTAYIEQARQSGARLVTGGKQIHPQGCENGYFVEPTIFADCLDEMPHVKDEIFGPVMSVLKFIEEDEVIRRANDTTYGLAAGVFTRDIQRAHRVISRLEAGICWINTYGNSPVEMPVGGYKHSGIGRENGVETLLQYTQTKAVYVGMGPIESPF
ncbi:MAG: betaine-aldehyde dehydrogenase [Deltaproteobacteria bacterium]|nr:betaine-aldehyde dehydrogenase [Deltaproteobacteria bacterium]